MKALTIWQPWCTLIARELKRVETRPWSTEHRGDIAIHAAARIPPIDLAGVQKIIDKHKLHGFMPLGKVICIAKLESVRPTEFFIELFEKMKGSAMKSAMKREIALGDYRPGRFGFVLTDIRLIRPFPIRGQQRMWNWQPHQGDLEFIDRPKDGNFHQEILI